MGLSAIVVVVLRLFALYWGASFLFGILGLMGLVDLSPIGPAELYTAAILVTGLQFFLSDLGGTVGWLYYLAANNAGDDLLKGRQGLSLFDVSQQLLPCAGGIYLVVFSRKFGRR